MVIPYIYKMFKFISCTLIILFLYGNSYAQDKGLKVKSSKGKDTAVIDFNRRIALIVGNAKYEKGELKNPAHDASRFADVLKKYGFEVILKTDLDRKELNKVINDFGDSITAKKGVSFFYYSGHGLQYNSKNYMLPLGSEIEKEEDISDEAVELNKVLEKMTKTNNGLNFVILDACRNNPVYSSLPGLPKGLTDKEKLPGNTSVFYATTPGDVAMDGTGTNSPFTEALAESITTTDSIEFYQVVRKVVKQVKSKTNPVQQPSITGSPEDEFYFKARKTKSRLFFLSIGISVYKNNALNLKYAQKDANNVAETFKKQQGLLYDEVKTWKIFDSHATRMQIHSTVNSIKQQVRPGDVIMIFFAGHNIISEVTGESYFLTADGDVDSVDITGVKYEDIRSLLADLPCKSVLFLEGSYNPRTIKELTSTENGVAIITSTGQHEYSYESDKAGGGFFTKALIEGVNGIADKAITGFVDLRSLYYYVDERVSNLSEGMQRPQFFIPSGISNFRISQTIITKLPKEKTEVMPAIR